MVVLKKIEIACCYSHFPLLISKIILRFFVSIYDALKCYYLAFNWTLLSVSTILTSDKRSQNFFCELKISCPPARLLDCNNNAFLKLLPLELLWSIFHCL